jgi:hypothetical protein
MILLRGILYGFLLIIGQQGFAQNLENLIYCQENLKINQIYFVNSDQFIGHTTDGESNYLLLFNNENLIIDTYKLGDINKDFLQSFDVLGSNLFVANTLNSRILLSIQGNNLQEEARNKNAATTGAVFEFNGISISTMPMSNKRKNSSFKIKVTFQGKEKWITENVKRIYTYQNSPFLPSKITYDRRKSKFYIVLEEAGILYSIGFDGQINSYMFPDKSEASKSWDILFDFEANQLYGLLFSKNGSYEVYKLGLNNDGKMEIRLVDSFDKKPVCFFSNKIIYQTTEKNENGKKMNCFYSRDLLQ